MTGCIQKYNVPDDKSDAIAEYMAGALLQSDISYKEDLTPEDELGIDTSDGENNQGENVSTTPTAIPTPAPGENTDNPSVTPGPSVNQYDLAQVIGAANFDIHYLDKKIVDKYPENAQNFDFTTTTPSKVGDKLLVVRFKLENKDTKDQSFNLIQQSIDYRLTDSQGIVYQPLFTLQLNDMRLINIKVPAGKTEIGLLIYEIPQDKVLTNSKLVVSNNDKTVTIELK